MDRAFHGSHADTQFVDFELAEKVESAVRKKLTSGASHLSVEPSEEGVVLRGYVRTYYQKQLAQSEALHMAGLGHVRDELEVI